LLRENFKRYTNPAYTHNTIQTIVSIVPSAVMTGVILGSGYAISSCMNKLFSAFMHGFTFGRRITFP